MSDDHNMCYILLAAICQGLTDNNTGEFSLLRYDNEWKALIVYPDGHNTTECTGRGPTAMMAILGALDKTQWLTTKKPMRTVNYSSASDDLMGLITQIVNDEKPGGV